MSRNRRKGCVWNRPDTGRRTVGSIGNVIRQTVEIIVGRSQRLKNAADLLEIIRCGGQTQLAGDLLQLCNIGILEHGFHSSRQIIVSGNYPNSPALTKSSFAIWPMIPQFSNCKTCAKTAAIDPTS